LRIRLQRIKTAPPMVAELIDNNARAPGIE
jgi:hypothetical protein